MPDEPSSSDIGCAEICDRAERGDGIDAKPEAWMCQQKCWWAVSMSMLLRARGNNNYGKVDRLVPHHTVTDIKPVIGIGTGDGAVLQLLDTTQ